MRLFIAIPLKEYDRNYVYDKISIVKSNVSEKLKWVEKDNLHITLKFIGDADKSAIAELKIMMKNLSKTIKQQYFKLGNIAAFPNLKYPRIIYISVRDDANILSFLHQSCEKYLSSFAIKNDKDTYTPHITLARTKRNTNIKKLSLDLNTFHEENICNKEILMEKISLFNSDLHKTGPVYREIFSYYFQEIL